MNRSVVGHLQNRKKLLQLLNTEQLAHACLFVGSRGIGKKLVALELAKAALCEDNQFKSAQHASCNQCPGCTLFDAGNHPDFHYFECEKTNFSAEQARELLNSINLKPFKAGKRVVIFNDAESLSSITANLLLKTLEEPTKNSLFLLVASNQSRLPLPVVSRCQVWRFTNLTKREIEQVISVHAEASKIEALADICDGTLEQLESYVKDDLQTKILSHELKQIIEGNSYAALIFAAQLAKDKNNLRLKIEILRAMLRNLLSQSRNNEQQLNIAQAMENLIHADRLIFERNFNALNLLEMTFLGLSGKIQPQSRSIIDIVL